MDFLEPFEWFGEHVVDGVDAVVEVIESAVDLVRRLHEDWQLIDLAVWVVPEYTPVRPEPPTTTDGDDCPVFGGFIGPTGVTVEVCGCGLHPVDSEPPSRAQREIEYQETIERYKQAEERAAQLLLDVLSPQQRATYEQYNWFEVISHGRRFRVYYITTSNIVEYSSITAPLKTWCIVPQGTDIPLSDALVSQKLMLDTDPGMLERIAVPGKYDPFRFSRVAERQSQQVAQGRVEEVRRQAFYERAIYEARTEREYRDALRRQNDYADDGSWYAAPLPTEAPWPYESPFESYG